MDVSIRHVEPEDAPAVHEILTSPHVVAGTMRLRYMPLASTKDRISVKQGVYQLVASADDETVGFAELITNPNNPRWSHYGELNMLAVRADVQRKGIATTLTKQIIDLAEKSLRLVRLDLRVWSDNETAIRLYESLGFEKEGLLKKYALSPTSFHDAVVMAKLFHQIEK